MWKETLVAIITVLMLAIVTAMIILAFTLDANATDYHTVVQQQGDAIERLQESFMGAEEEWTNAFNDYGGAVAGATALSVIELDPNRVSLGFGWGISPDYTDALAFKAGIPVGENLLATAGVTVNERGGYTGGAGVTVFLD